MKGGGQILLLSAQDLVAEGKTPYERRFEKPFKGPIIPYGAMVEYHMFHRKISQEFINLARKCYLESFSDMS